VSLALLAALITAGVKFEPDVVLLFEKLFHHKNHPAAVKAAIAAVDATPQDGPTPGGTNDPNSPYFSE
jgi:LmbE family N-acetylglucosaminyl deacetylase